MFIWHLELNACQPSQPYIVTLVLHLQYSGTMTVPLTRTDSPPVGLGLWFVTAVFCAVDGGKTYVARNRSEAKLVNAEIVAVMRNVLRQVRQILSV